VHFKSSNGTKMCLRLDPAERICVYLRYPSWIWEKAKENGMKRKKSNKSQKEGKECKGNKKSELMLMRRARAHSSSCSQVILVYLHLFHCNSLLCSQKSAKNHQKPIFLGFKVNQSKSLILTILRRSSPVLVIISSMSVPICNHFTLDKLIADK